MELEIKGQFYNQYCLMGINQWTTGNHFKRAKYKQDALEVVCYQLSSQVKDIKIDKPFTIHLHLGEPIKTKGRARDIDNAGGFALKVILDALQELNVIKDDGRENMVAYSVDYEKTNEPFIKITIKEKL